MDSHEISRSMRAVIKETRAGGPSDRLCHGNRTLDNPVTEIESGGVAATERAQRRLG